MVDDSGPVASAALEALAAAARGSPGTQARARRSSQMVLNSMVQSCAE
jgi:hypothetical protein